MRQTILAAPTQPPIVRGFSHRTKNADITHRHETYPSRSGGRVQSYGHVVRVLKTQEQQSWKCRLRRGECRLRRFNMTSHITVTKITFVGPKHKKSKPIDSFEQLAFGDGVLLSTAP